MLCVGFLLLYLICKESQLLSEKIVVLVQGVYYDAVIFVLQDKIYEEKLTIRPPVFSFVCCKIMLEEDEYWREFASYKSCMIGCFAKVGYLPVHKIIIVSYLTAKLLVIILSKDSKW